MLSPYLLYTAAACRVPALWGSPKLGRTTSMERDEVPEADAYEQDQDAFPEADDDEVEVDRVDRVSDDPEAPEADALEQAQPVPGEDEERE
jgi:hypothetical protein